MTELSFYVREILSLTPKEEHMLRMIRKTILDPREIGSNKRMKEVP
jgi:hypothetical protein